MANSVKLIFFALKRSARSAVPLTSVLFAAELVFFIGVRIAGEAGAALTSMETYTLLPGAFYLIALAVPLMIFLRTAVGREACFVHSLPVYPDTPLSAMMISTMVWAGAAELCRTAMCAFGLFMTASLMQLGDREQFMLLFSVYGMAGYALIVTRNILGVMFFQLFAAMVTLLADMSAHHRRLLAVIYGSVGSVLIFFAFALLVSKSSPNSGTPGAAFIFYLPQIIFLLCFITIFGVVSAFILKRRREVR